MLTPQITAPFRQIRLPGRATGRHGMGMANEVKNTGFSIVGLFALNRLFVQVEDAVTGWINEKIAAYFGWEEPSVADVTEILWNWGIPILLVIGAAWAYHYFNKSNRQAKPVSSDAPHKSNQSSSEPIEYITVRGQIFKNRILQLDKHNYIECSFEFVTFEYEGGPWSIINCKFLNYNIITTKTLAVSGTVNFLKVLGALNDDFAKSWQQH